MTIKALSKVNIRRTHDCFFVTADRCPPPPEVDNTDLVEFNDTSGSGVYQCVRGHRFPDGYIHKTIQCSVHHDGNRWIPQHINACLRKLWMC